MLLSRAGTSQNTASEALNKALKASIHATRSAKMSHMLVRGVKRNGRDWQAIVDIAYEPGESGQEQQKRETPELEEGFEVAGPQSVKSVAEEYVPEEEDYEEQEREKERKKRREQELVQAEEHRREREQAFTAEQQVLAQDTEFTIIELEVMTHIYLDTEVEPYFYPISHEYDESDNIFVHVLPRGPLWEAAERYFPEEEFDKATHPKEYHEHIGKAAPGLEQQFERIQSLARKPKLEVHYS